MVSVIVPVYNVASFLREALNNVINQSYKDIEIIIIDDGSTDGSSEICDEYKGIDKRIRVIHQANQGLSAARNVGLDLMTGDAVVFLDSDDKYHLEFISMMAYMLAYSQSDMVVCKYLTQNTMDQMKWDDGGTVLPSIRPGIYNREEAFRALIYGSLNLHVWNKMYRSKLWNTIRFAEGHVYEDGEVAYRIIELCDTICVIDNSLYLYRKRPGSITRTLSLSNAKDRILAFASIENYINSRVPDYFTLEQLNKVQERYIKISISTYLNITSKDVRERRVFRRELRRELIDKTETVDLSNICVKMAGYMIRYCPILLCFIYKIYSLARSLFRKQL